MSAGELIKIDKQAQEVLDEIAKQQASAPKPTHALTEQERIAALRQAYAASAVMGGDPEPVTNVVNGRLPGAVHVPIRIYDPQPGATSVPAVLWFHGGSFVAGDLETHDRPLRALANRLHFPVISVAWRLAPEFPYPAGLEDAKAAFRAAEQGQLPVSVDKMRIALGGDSAGGAIAAIATRHLAETGGLAPAFQVLIYPNTDLAASPEEHPSWVENNGRVLDRADQERNWYLYSGEADRADPSLSPLRAVKLSGLPPTFLATGEADPQRDEGEAYGHRLREAGVPVEHIRYPGMIHGFFQMAAAIDAGKDLIERVARQTRTALQA